MKSRINFEDIGQTAEPKKTVKHPIAYMCGCVAVFTVSKNGYWIETGGMRTCDQHRKEIEGLGLWE